MESKIYKAESITDEDIIEKSHIEYESYVRNGRRWLRKRDKHTKSTIYNLPIAASKDFEGIKEAKQKIKEGGYKDSDIEYFLNRVVTDEFIKKIKKSVDHNSIFLPMPSTSGENTIPKRLAQRLSNKLGIEVIIAPVILPYSKVEAKKIRGIDKLLSPPKYIIPLEMERLLKKYHNRDIFIVDDIFTTGFSVNHLAMTLEDNGFHIPEIITLSKSSSSFTSQGNVDKMIDIAVERFAVERETAKKKLEVLLSVSSTIGKQVYQDLNSKTKHIREKYSNWFLDLN